MGALKVAAMPPAAATAARFRRRSSFSRHQVDSSDANEPPICTTGPSVPNDAPLPIDSAVASGRHSSRPRDTRPPRFETATIMCGMPDPRVSGAKRSTIGATRKPPSAGVATVTTAAGSQPILSRNVPTSVPVPPTSASNATAASPARLPTTIALPTSDSVSDDAPPAKAAKRRRQRSTNRFARRAARRRRTGGSALLNPPKQSEPVPVRHLVQQRRVPAVLAERGDQPREPSGVADLAGQRRAVEVRAESDAVLAHP